MISINQIETPKPAPKTNRLARLAVNSEGFVFDPTTGDSFLVNTVALAILQGLQQGQESSEILKELAERFNVASDQLQRDFAIFEKQLTQLQLI